MLVFTTQQLKNLTAETRLFRAIVSPSTFIVQVNSVERYVFFLNHIDILKTFRQIIQVFVYANTFQKLLIDAAKL